MTELKVMTMKELLEMKSPSPKDLGIETDYDGIRLYWYNTDAEYFIEWSRLNSKEKLCEWLIHLTEKVWPRMTPKSIHYFMNEVYSHFQWNQGLA